MSKKSDLPFGSEFSPSQIELPALLEMIQQNQGDWRGLEEAILKRFFKMHGQSDELKRQQEQS